MSFNPYDTGGAVAVGNQENEINTPGGQYYADYQNSGKTVADYDGTDPEGYYKYMIENDPDNAVAWREKLGSLYESNSSVSRYMKQLQDAGINPLYMLGSGGISTNAVSSGNSVANYASNRRANDIAYQRVGTLLGSGLGVAAIAGLVKILVALL